MANTYYISPGAPFTIAQTTAYALPAKKVTLFSDTALQLCNDTIFTTTAALAATTILTVSGGFIRCTTSTAIVTLKVD